jgi:hypothetical protein
MAKAKISRSQRIRNMLKDGITPKEIAQACGVKPQVVYNIRYMMNKKGGIATLPKPKLTKDGIANVPRKRGRPRKVSPTSAPTPIVVPPSPLPGSFVEAKRVESSDGGNGVLLAVAAFFIGAALTLLFVRA